MNVHVIADIKHRALIWVQISVGTCCQARLDIERYNTAFLDMWTGLQVAWKLMSDVCAQLMSTGAFQTMSLDVDEVSDGF